MTTLVSALNGGGRESCGPPLHTGVLAFSLPGEPEIVIGGDMRVPVPVALEPLPQGAQLARRPDGAAATAGVEGAFSLRLAGLEGLWAGDYGPHGPETLLVRCLPSAALAAGAAAATALPTLPVGGSGAPRPSAQLRLAPRGAPPAAAAEALALALSASALAPASPLGAGAAGLAPWAGDPPPRLVVVGTKVTGDQNVPSGQVSFVAWALGGAEASPTDAGAAALGGGAAPAAAMQQPPLMGAALAEALEAAQPITANRATGPASLSPSDLDVDVA